MQVMKAIFVERKSVDCNKNQHGKQKSHINPYYCKLHRIHGECVGDFEISDVFIVEVGWQRDFRAPFHFWGCLLSPRVTSPLFKSKSR